MRLACVLNHWFPHGGLQKDLIKVVQACSPRADTTIYCMSWEGEVPPDFTVVQVPVQGWTARARRAAFARHVVQQVRPQHDCVLGFNRMPGLDYYFAADTCFAEKAFNERGWWYRLTPRVRQYLAFERAVFGPDSTTTALLLSPQQREQYTRHYHTEASRLVDLPPGIGREHCASAAALQQRAEIRLEFGLSEQELLVLQVGSGFHTKGLERSLAALAALPESVRLKVHYLLVGRDRSDPWLQRAQQMGLGERVRILPPRDDIPALMQGADVLLHPSLHESAGLVILEAIVGGLPVLTTANCGYALHVERAQAGIVCPAPFDQKLLNAALLALLEAERGKWRANGIRYGQEQDLYGMPEAVAKRILQDDRGSR